MKHEAFIAAARVRRTPRALAIRAWSPRWASRASGATLKHVIITAIIINIIIVIKVVLIITITITISVTAMLVAISSSIILGPALPPVESGASLRVSPASAPPSSQLRRTVSFPVLGLAPRPIPPAGRGR